MHARGALILSLFLSLLLSVRAVPPDCSLLNGRSIKLITFDVFAALFDTKSTLENKVATEFNTGIGSTVTMDFYNEWIRLYAEKAGTAFDSSSIPGYPQPFPYVVNTGLQSTLSNPAFPSLINPTPPAAPPRTMFDDYPTDSPQFKAVVAGWGSLAPFSDTVSALQSLSAAGYTLGLLSNGDSPTLLALAALLPGVNITYIFPSDLPPNGSGAFKPNAATYARVLTATGLTSDQVVHVAGGSSDASGARDGGLLSILVVRPPGATGPGTAPCTTFTDANPLASILPFLQQGSTPTSSPTPSPTMSSPTPSSTPSPTPTPSDTPTSTPTPTSAPTNGSSLTGTPTSPSTVTPTPSSSSTITLTPSLTPTISPRAPSPPSSSGGLDGGSVAGIVIFVLLVVGAGGVLATSAVARAHAWRLWRKLRAVVLGTGVGGIDITDKRPVALAEEVEFANPVPHKVSASV